MASVWCPNCQTLKQRAKKCTMCGFIEEDKSETYKLPKNNRTARILKPKKENIKIFENQNPIIIIAITVIAISVAYLAINKYKENVQIEESKKQMKQIINNANNQLDKTMKELENNRKKMINDIGRM